MDKSVEAIRKLPLFRDAHWAYYDKNARVRTNKGAYLICDNGYLRWLTTICPFTRVDNAQLMQQGHAQEERSARLFSCLPRTLRHGGGTCGSTRQRHHQLLWQLPFFLRQQHWQDGLSEPQHYDCHADPWQPWGAWFIGGGCAGRAWGGATSATSTSNN